LPYVQAIILKMLITEYLRTYKWYKFRQISTKSAFFML